MDIQFLIRQRFKGSVINRALPSLPGGSLEFTFTVPLSIYLTDARLNVPVNISENNLLLSIDNYKRK